MSTGNMMKIMLSHFDIYMFVSMFVSVFSFAILVVFFVCILLFIGMSDDEVGELFDGD